ERCHSQPLRPGRRGRGAVELDLHLYVMTNVPVTGFLEQPPAGDILRERPQPQGLCAELARTVLGDAHERTTDSSSHELGVHGEPAVEQLAADVHGADRDEPALVLDGPRVLLEIGL